MLRTSSYTIYVDLPDTKEEILLVHGYTGAYDRVSRNVARYVRSLEVRRPPKPLYGDWSEEPLQEEGLLTPPTEATIEVLRKRGYLTELTPSLEEDFFASFVSKLHERNIRQSPNYIFMPTYNCNLRCAYCFQDHMRSDAKFRHLLKTMSAEVVDRIFAGIPQIEALHGLAEGTKALRSVGFFGGEPLLAVNRPRVEQIMQRARELGPASFWAVSNATELEVYEDLLGPQGIAMVQITLDGIPREHDKRRIYADGSGSFSKIAANISLCLARETAVSVRLNLDRINILDLPQLVAEMRVQGWDRSQWFSVYTAPVRPENDIDRTTTFDTWQLDQALTEMIGEQPDLALVRRPDDGIKEHARRIFQLPDTNLPNLKESYCSAHNRMYIFDAFADIYACWERTGDPQIRIGHVAEDGDVTLNAEVSALWRSRTVATNPVCRRCRYALHCGGGCAVLAIGKTGRYHANFCDGFANRFRSNVAEAFLDHMQGVALMTGAAKVCDQ